jgi:hypothetical protein
VPRLSGAISFLSLMLFWVINYPGLPIKQLLPDPEDPSIYWRLFSYVVLISSTAVWLFITASTARYVSRRATMQALNATNNTG